MPIEKLRPTFTFDQDRLDALKQVVPEAFADGKINWDTLREALGEHLEGEGSDENFGLFWPGKREARRLASQPSKGTLVPMPGEGVNEEDTSNIFIEGDNLEVLKLLQKSYAGRVKLIYIDPPYNTGNDFVYDDDYKEPLSHYLGSIGKADDEGNLLSTNSRADGRFHSKWLNMIYPRLVLARSLLRQDGAIFITVDDNESCNLRQVLNEVFGENNFRSQISWQKKYSVSNNFKGIASIRDHILVYSRSEEFKNGFLPRSEESKSRYTNPDNDARGPWKAVDYWNQASPQQRPNLVYGIQNPTTGEEIWPSKKAWKYSKETYEQHIRENKIWWGVSGENSVPALKLFLSEVRDGLIPHNWWPHEEAGHTDEAKKELLDLFPEGSPFETPKPTRLIKRICQVAGVGDNDIILDFFAGSASTAQAIAEFNVEEGSDCSFILVQLPEPTPPKSPAYRQGFNTVAEIGKERIRRSISSIGEGRSNIGFRSFRLEQSRFKEWDAYEGDDVQEVQTLFDQFETPLRDGWKKEDLLSEVLLMQGYPLSSDIQSLPDFQHNEVIQVTTGFFDNRLFVCLDDKVAQETIQQLDLRPEDRFVCLDAALTDQAKMRLADACNLHVI